MNPHKMSADMPSARSSTNSTVDVVTRLPASTPLDQLFADIEAEERNKKMEARLEEIHRNRVIPLHRRIRKRNESTIFAVDKLVCSKATTTTKQLQPTIPRDTTPVDAHGTDLHEYLFEVKYMAC
jgi:hypothetical protein